MTFSEIIAAHRKRLGLTQEGLALQLGVTNQAVSKWESGQSCPDIALLPKLADRFGITIDALFGREPQALAAQTALDWPNDGVLRVVLYAGHQYIGSSPADQDIRFCYEGPALNIESAVSVSCDTVAGNVTAGGDVHCDTVYGHVQAGGSVSCDDVRGNISAQGSVSCDDVAGSVNAGGNVTCDCIEGSVYAGGNVQAGGSVSCDDVRGNISAQGSVSCDDVAGSVNAGGNVQADEINGSTITAGGGVSCDHWEW